MSSDVVAPTDGLFDASVVTTPSDDTMQWRAALLQLVNWGGFSGLTSVPLRGDTTMISGASVMISVGVRGRVSPGVMKSVKAVSFPGV